MEPALVVKVGVNFFFWNSLIFANITLLPCTFIFVHSLLLSFFSLPFLPLQAPTATLWGSWYWEPLPPPIVLHFWLFCKAIIGHHHQHRYMLTGCRGSTAHRSSPITENSIIDAASCIIDERSSPRAADCFICYRCSVFLELILYSPLLWFNKCKH